ncbi:MAG: heme-binding protein, partial [Actinomycetota bacterium]|nr:heme-binding protein [Actinomycetota bacterium]
MVDGRTHDIPLKDARALIQRAIDKAEQLGLRGGIAVVGASGALVSTSRMDRGGAGGMTRARSKAWISATQQVPSAEHLARMNFVSPPVEQGFKSASPESLFPGAGGMPISVSGKPGDEIIGGIAASGATVSPFFPAGIAQEKMIADGRPANPEDLLIHYALGIPYLGQHGDDLARWDRSFGAFPADPPSGLGMADAPRASAQHEHEWAVGLADEVMAEASARGVKVAVAIVDHRGDPIQQDVMDGAATFAAFASLALAATSATFQCPSVEVAARYGTPDALRQLGTTLPFPILTTAGGLPIVEEGRFVGGLGIAGPTPELS